MAYNTKSLIVDAYNRIVAQYFNPITDKYEAVEGADGATNMQLTGSNVKPAVILPTNTTTVSTGTPQTVGTLKTLRIEVWGTGTYTLQIQGIGPSGTARNLPVWDNINRAFLASNNIVAAGFYDIDVQGYTSVQANVSAISGGNVNASGGLMA